MPLEKKKPDKLCRASRPYWLNKLILNINDSVQLSMKVAEIMNKEPALIYGGNTAQEAAEKMKLRNRGLLAVVNNEEERKVMGVLSNKDIINKVIAEKGSVSEIRVSDIMTREVIHVKPEAATSEAMSKIIKYGIKRVLVMENGVLQGIVSSTDIIDGMIKYKKELLDMAINF
ncbi:CBS domain-containing protein [Candidatus Woesearchaeota archaeon]|nr:CBS domain-containing protein [Candidatus Woesearchaeota archaeon]